MSASGTTGEVIRAPSSSVPGDEADADAPGAGVASGAREHARAGNPARAAKTRGRTEDRIAPFLYHERRYCTSAALLDAGIVTHD